MAHINQKYLLNRHHYFSYNFSTFNLAIPLDRVCIDLCFIIQSFIYSFWNTLIWFTLHNNLYNLACFTIFCSLIIKQMHMHAWVAKISTTLKKKKNLIKFKFKLVAKLSKSAWQGFYTSNQYIITYGNTISFGKYTHTHIYCLYEQIKLITCFYFKGWSLLCFTCSLSISS